MALGPIEAVLRGRLDTKGPGVRRRAPLGDGLHTGIKILDALVPVAFGSHALVLGDRGSGKTAIAVDTILSQRGRGVHCVYVAIGQRLSEVGRVVELLEARGAMEHSTVVVASASDAAPLRCVAPFTGMTLAEHYRDTGRHALCVLDDLGSHAHAHEEVALLADRPLGGEGHPADLVSVHARLLERAARCRPAEGEPRGGGSLTVISLVETQSGDRSAFLPRSLSLLSDMQIVLDADLFRAGRRPAIDTHSSTTLARRSPIKALAGTGGWKYLGYDLLSYQAMAEFAKLAIDLDKKTRAQLDRGARLVEILKQDAHAPISAEQQALVLYAGTHGLLDDLQLSDLRRFERELLALVASEHQGLLDDLAHRSIDADLGDRMRQVIVQLKKSFRA
jgi:F-type H+-transporting ATPase subunit alpha